jgi:hypothetical protein
MLHRTRALCETLAVFIPQRFDLSLNDGSGPTACTELFIEQGFQLIC